MANRIMSFSQFERVYESEMHVDETADAIMPPEDDKESSVIKGDGDITETPDEILDLFKETAEEGKAESSGGEDKEKKSNESLDHEYYYVNEATPSVNTLKIAKKGEQSDRVKEIQKLLGQEETGKFDQALEDAVKKFQDENKLTVDGKVGTQTYGSLLKIKKDVKEGDEEFIKQMEAFKKAGKVVISASKKGANIALDPRFYEIFERIEIVTVNGVTYVVATPKQNAAEKVNALKESNLLVDGFEWLLSIPMAVGKAIVYTTIGAAVVTTEVAKAMVHSAVALGSAAGKALSSMASNVVYGLGQLTKWAKSKGSEILSKIKSGANDAIAMFKGFCTKAGNAAKSTAKGFLAFCSGVAGVLSKGASTFRDIAHKALMPIGSKIAELGIGGAKNLGELVKTGVQKLKEGAKALASTIQSGFNAAVTRTKEIGNAVVSGFKSAGKAVVNAIGSSLETAGEWVSSAGSWIKGLVESLESPEKLLLLEWLQY